MASKAAEWAAHNQTRPVFKPSSDLYCDVSDDGLCRIRAYDPLTPEQVHALIAWLIDTFGEPVRREESNNQPEEEYHGG